MRQLASLAAAFQARFGKPPAYAACAPGRVNLIGEHTDYNQGFVLPIAIDRQTIVLAAPTSMRQSILWSCDLDEQLEIDLTAPLAPIAGSFANYVLGVIAQFKRRGHSVKNMAIAIDSNVPIGAGLSSSAALEVAVATLMEHILRIEFAPLQKALLCQAAEHEFAGTPCGIMDMYVSAAAKPGNALFLDCRSNKCQHIPVPDQGQCAILIADTQVRHELNSGNYAARRAACASAASKLGVPALRDARTDVLQRAGLSIEEHRCALHVISENSRTILAAEALARGDLRSFGNLMFASHDSLRDLYQVSSPELDLLVEAAREFHERGASDVFGSRMTGAGFGGCTVTLCRTEAVGAIQQHLRERFAAKFGREPNTFVVTPAAGARMLVT